MSLLKYFLKDMSTWMRDLSEVKKSESITELIIPGSHNSGTFELFKNLPVGPDESELVQKLGNNPILGKFTKSIIYRWGRCQHASILDQLHLGIDRPGLFFFLLFYICFYPGQIHFTLCNAYKKIYICTGWVNAKCKT